MNTLQYTKSNMECKFVLNPRYVIINGYQMLDKTNYRKYNITDSQYEVIKNFQYTPRLLNLEEIGEEMKLLNKYLVLNELIKKEILLTVNKESQFEIIF